MRKTLSAAAVAAVAAASVLTPTAAFAKAVTIDDAKGDVWKVSYDEKGGESNYTDAGSVANIDIDKSTVSHSDKRISLKVSFHELKKNDTSPNIQVLVQTDDETEYYMYAYAYQGEDGWETGGFVGESHASRGGGGEICEGVKSHADFTKNYMTVSGPRSCFGSPAWIKAHVVTYGADYSGETPKSYYDNGHVKGHAEHKPWTDRIKKG